ncbi:hypothetical protein LPU83_pLPU83c_0368 (plasmid) [Rhizobium favelukesii]|uniref:Uncharacterized protein n=1 Tax=Rhizobium favelukesii TaxID=348824 RepID=W6RKZ7_9HYPH|nr:hypothetical protein LPU83_pLPU83c_0368 [Rhizobium favelukesii]
MPIERALAQFGKHRLVHVYRLHFHGDALPLYLFTKTV